MNDRFRWRIEGARGAMEVQVLATAGATIARGEAGLALDAEERESLLGGDHPSPLARLRLRAMAAALDPRSLTDLETARAVVVRAALQGRIARHAPTARARGGAGAVEESPSPPLASGTTGIESKTWVAVHLEWETEPPRPAAGVRYRLRLPDGSLREGRLDAAGQARVDGIDPGVCLVEFPDLDAQSQAPVTDAPPRGAGRAGAEGAAGFAAPPPVCRAVDVAMLEPRGRRAYRQVGAARVLQVVPAADHKIGGGFGFTFSTANGGAMPAVDEFREAWRVWRGRAEGRPSGEKGHGAREWSARLLAATLGGGVSRLYARVETRPPCSGTHAMVLTGPGVDTLVQPRERFDLAFRGEDLGPRSVPTVYALSGEGCEGQPTSLQIEVFPPTVRVCSGSLEATLKESVVERIAAWLSTYFRGAIKVAGEAVGFATFELTEGWREEDRDWNAFWTRQFTLRVGCRWRLEGRSSLAWWTPLVPQSLQPYAPDFGLLLSGELTLNGAPSSESREEPGPGRIVPAASPKRRVDTTPVEARMAIALGGYARVGSERLLGVMVTLTAECEIVGQIFTEDDPPKLKVDGRVELSEGRAVLRAMGAALFMSGEANWQVPLWSKQTLMSEEPWFLSTGAPS